MTLWAFNRPFKILGCDPFTSQYYLEKYEKIFPVGGHDEVANTDKNSKKSPLILIQKIKEILKQKILKNNLKSYYYDYK